MRRQEMLRIVKKLGYCIIHLSVFFLLNIRVDGRKKLVIRERDRVHLEINHPSYGVIVAKVINNVDLYGNENELRIIEILKNDPPQTYPFIIRNYEYKQYEQQTIILMEHANLGNLFDFIKASNNLSYSTIRIIMKQLLLGLNYLHSKGIIHRDIKGQNIMLHSPPGCGIVFVKIGDYGEVKISEQNPFLSMTMSYKG
ncbi:MAG: hypothetical protein EZS28_027831, partial [Streblomastix strix]